MDLLDSIKKEKSCRCYLKVDDTILHNYGFKSQTEAKKWIEHLSSLNKIDWCVGFLFKIKQDNLLYEIVRRGGKKLIWR